MDDRRHQKYLDHDDHDDDAEDFKDYREEEDNLWAEDEIKLMIQLRHERLVSLWARE